MSLKGQEAAAHEVLLGIFGFKDNLVRGHTVV